MSEEVDRPARRLRADRLRSDPESAAPGIWLTLGLHFVAFVITAIIGATTSEAFLAVTFGIFIGVSQLIYMIPAIGIAALWRKKALAKGMIIGASLTFILNAICGGIFFAASAFG